MKNAEPLISLLERFSRQSVDLSARPALTEGFSKRFLEAFSV